MRRHLLAILCAGAVFGAGPGVGQSLGGGSLLSSYDRSLIRAPQKGRLAGTPRGTGAREPIRKLGTTLDDFTPGAFGADEFGHGPYQTMARSAARRHGVPETLFLKLVRQESNFRPTARSHKGAIGLAQLMPGTARILGVDPHDPEENLEGGARYLAQQYRKFRSWRLALAAYNAGPQAVERYGGVPPYRETRNYVQAILSE